MCPILSPKAAVLHDHLMIGTNWSGTYTYQARDLHRPQTLEELQDLVANGGRLHAVGTRHSFNDVADAEALISVADLPGEVIIDEDAHTVRVPAATRYGDLAARLQSAGWALANLPRCHTSRWPDRWRRPPTARATATRPWRRPSRA